jgi:hypothetical protein
MRNELRHLNRLCIFMTQWVPRKQFGYYSSECGRGLSPN